MSNLELLCRPLLKLLCEYCCYVKAGATVEPDALKWQIRLRFNEISSECENDAALRREFLKVEQALVFFIDYTIKEGDFPFRNEWKEMARDYNELSGDEKFFDQLSETLDDPDAAERLKIFYLLMGLGFDGVYINNKEYVERRMKLCATRFQMPEPVTADSLFIPAKILPKKRSGKSRLLLVVIMLTVAFAIGAFAYNYHVFTQDSADYKAALEMAVDKAVPSNIQTQAETAQPGEK